MLPKIAIGDLTISTYYLFMAFGFAAMVYLMVRRRTVFSLTVPKAVLFSCLIMISGLMGCKALFILENFQSVRENGITLGGFSFFGAVFFIPVAMLLLGKRFRLAAGQSLDACAPCVCAMIGTIRVGCFLNGCCGGYLVNIGGHSFRWPTQMLESLCDLVILGWLLSCEERGKSDLYPRFLVSYGMIRFLIEFLRDTPKDWFLLSHGQVFATVAAIIGSILLAKERVKNASEK